jgi:hypothetical protein
MEELRLCEAAAGPASGNCLAPLGLSENDCLHITDFVRSIAPGWQTDLQQDAFGQLGLIMAPCNTNRLKRALIAYRINASWFLDEVREGAYREVGEFQTIGGILEALCSRLVDCSAPPAGNRSDRVDEGIKFATAAAASATSGGDAESFPVHQDVTVPLNRTTPHAAPS